MNTSNSFVGIGAVRPAAAAHVRMVWRLALALRGAVRRFIGECRRQRLARVDLRTLQSLDEHTLRDLGFYRSDIPSAAPELLGGIDLTRARIAHSVGYCRRGDHVTTGSFVPGRASRREVSS